MTSRERLLRAFEGREFDRVPVSPFIWTNFVNKFFKTGFTNLDEELDEKFFTL